ncbi:MAG: hypothetical protein J0H71_08300 [Rhizobiales bacterium]|nr:hypothetical protein [Hyphomicrobiales bacterium]
MAGLARPFFLRGLRNVKKLYVIASEAKQSRKPYSKNWIVSPLRSSQ